MTQETLSDIEYSCRKKATRREKFLTAMDGIVPWSDWVEKIRPHYPDGKIGRPPKDIETMLRMYLMQKWYHLSDAAMEDAIYDSYAMRNFMHLDFMAEQVPASTTLRRFRILLEKQGLNRQIEEDIRERLKKARLSLRTGSLADAALVALPRPGEKPEESNPRDGED